MITVFLDRLSKIDINAVPLEDDLRRELSKHLRDAEYHLECLGAGVDRLLAESKKSLSDMVFVDFWSADGIAGLYAKKIGFGKVVSVFENVESLKIAKIVSQAVGVAPDVVLQGDALHFNHWCKESGVRPDIVTARNVIDRVYVLDEFFATMHEVSPEMCMWLTTEANPYNPKRLRRLHRQQLSAEKVYRAQRRDYIAGLHPDMNDRLLDYWSQNTRGLSKVDIERAVESQSPNLLLDPYNTCHPDSGMWVSRLMTVDDYSQLLLSYGYKLTVLPGRCNTHLRGLRGFYSRRNNIKIDKYISCFEDYIHPRKQRRKLHKALRHAPFMQLFICGVR